jgi:Flp pilus assembly protein TadB
MTDDKNEKYVTLQMCSERSQRIMDKLEVIDKRLTKIEENQGQNIRDWRMFALSILSGTIVAVITWLIHIIR